ncbi:MOSC domain-containing protein [Altererythrobacter lauratis]|uniref:MOSC domain-containing protein n=1 Tax=Alteraurantiacibacter lauratis TaxID=2054627 RepID=A0ABV7EH62_9SPHN
MNPVVRAICAGQPVPFRGEEASAIAKQPLAGPVRITQTGVAGDAQADRKHHGGPDMALHLYPLDHMAFWRGELGDHPLLAEPGSFGSNIAVHGQDEMQVHIGDRFRLGTALIEVSQPRQPCWKIAHRFGDPKMVRRIVQTARCGWYFRVLEEGTAQAGDVLHLVEQGQGSMTVARCFGAIWGHPRQDRADTLRAIVAVPALADKLRGQVADILAGR